MTQLVPLGDDEGDDGAERDKAETDFRPSQNPGSSEKRVDQLFSGSHHAAQCKCQRKQNADDGFRAKPRFSFHLPDKQCAKQ
jgi:hypothetical protein